MDARAKSQGYKRDYICAETKMVQHEGNEVDSGALTDN